jgi:hypothetical protein
MNNTAMHDEATMQQSTAIASERHVLALAPPALTSGTTPTMNANDLIMIGRKRRRAGRV